ncbi:MAG: hypothetical protein FJ399_05000 [Verrucomicrobia bacterium]|nr:hypothetical protein [Verrucomicrobiota bacterium]
MTLEFHPAVQQDFNAAINYYAVEGGFHLADRFEASCGTVWWRSSPGRGTLRLTTAAPYSGGFGCAISLTLSCIAKSRTS